MQKRTIKRVLTASLIITGLTGFFAFSQASQAEPGSDQDPVVTLSYVEKRIQDVLDTLNPKIEALANKESVVISEPEPNIAEETQSAAYEVVYIEPGSFVYFGASTEVILRGGKASAIASANGGLADLTAGRDIQTNEIIPDNHLLLIARDDGRGIAVSEGAWLLIKGSYSVVQ